MGLGFEQAGFDVLAAVEIDPVHAAIHKYNFPECAVLPQSVQDVSGELIRKISAIGDRSVDVVFGGAPCQGFSLIGQRVLEDLPDAEACEELRDTDQAWVESWQSHSDYARKMRCESADAWHYGYKRKWNPGMLTSSYRTEHSSISRTRFAETKPGAVEPISRFFKLSPDGVSNTLRAGTDGARGAFTSPRPIHYKHNRCVTVREMARLHGFPDWFRFQQTKWHGARQIGNAVPPPLARAVAGAVIEAMGVSIARPRRILELGDEALLRMDMTQAAKYWNVPVPLSKRTLKSGVLRPNAKAFGYDFPAHCHFAG